LLGVDAYRKRARRSAARSRRRSKLPPIEEQWRPGRKSHLRELVADLHPRGYEARHVHVCAAVSSTTIEIGSPDVAIARSEARTTVVRPLGLWDAVSIIVGVGIGAGIYETVPLVLSNVATPGQAMGVWLAGGLLSLIGATCYAELASTYPRSGGDYVYLSRAFGPLVGFLFRWAQLAVILTGSIGMMAYLFSDYATALWGIDGMVATLLAAGAVVALSALKRPFGVPFYPVLPVIFCATAGYMLVSAIEYAGKLMALGALPVIAGIPFYFASKRRPSLASIRGHVGPTETATGDES
jgi:hypothetical protein